MAIFRLGDVCEIKVGKDCRIYNNKNNFVDKSNLYYLDINYFMSLHSYVIKTTNKCANEKWKDSIFENVILCSRTGNTACNFKILECKAVLDNRWNILIPNEKIINKKYLCYLLSKRKNILMNNLSFTTQPNITQNHLENFFINLIDIKEQQKIIDIIEPKEYLYKKYSNLINIDNYDSLIKSWNILIDIIEPFEVIQNYINQKLNKMNYFLIDFYKWLKTKNKIEFNKLCNIYSKKYNNQKFYVDTSSVKTSIIKHPAYLKKKKSRSNLTVALNSIIFSKLRGENKVYPIFKESLLGNVYSTGFINIISDYSAYVYGFLLSNDFITLKNNNSVGTLMEGINNKIVNNWYINELNYEKWNKDFDLSLALINYYNELIIKIDKIIKLLLSLYIS